MNCDKDLQDGHLFSAKSLVVWGHFFPFRWHLRGETSNCFQQGPHVWICVPDPSVASAGFREFSRLKPTKKNFWQLNHGKSGSWSKFISGFPSAFFCLLLAASETLHQRVLVPILPRNSWETFNFFRLLFPLL